MLTSEVFYLLLLLAAAFCFFGYWKDKPWLSIFGFTILFIASIQLTTGIQFISGVTITETSSTVSVLTYDYGTTYTNILMGVIGCFLAVGGVTLVFFETNWRTF